MPQPRTSAKGTSGGTGGTRETSGGKEKSAEPIDRTRRSKRPPPESSSKREPRPIDPGLYVVATPIGHADDITLRALKVLREADIIACEDTRVTAKLAARHGIATRRIAYHDHNAEKMRPALLGRLREGGTVALVSDAGTPLVSDPGFKLVREALAEGLSVTVVPGASATLAALVLSGLPSDRFLFAGFLTAKQTARRRELHELKAIPATLIFFEGASRLGEALTDMAEVLGDRPASVARELTKLHEEVRRDGLAALAAHYREAGPPRGEIVIVVGPPGEVAPDEPGLDERLRAALPAMSLRDASEAVATATGLPRRQVYARALELAAKSK